MTMTVKFPLELESGLRRYAQSSGVTASVVIREAVAQYLAQVPAAPRSAHELGADLFGRHHGPADLAARRKDALAALWADKQSARAGLLPTLTSLRKPARKPASKPAVKRSPGKRLGG